MRPDAAGAAWLEEPEHPTAGAPDVPIALATRPIAAAFVALSLLAGTAQAAEPASAEAVKAVAFDYVDGQLQGDVARVAASLHPDLAKRGVTGQARSARELFPMRRMSADELVELTKAGALKTPEAEWSRQVTVLDAGEDTAAVRVETPWFVDQLQLARFGERWLIVNALWSAKTPALEAAAAGAP